MGINNNVFASKSERRNYYKLCRTWGDKYRTYHNLPFLNVFNSKDLVDISDWKNLRSFTLNDLEFNRLKKTSIDFTLCDDWDNPILCIEFDGLQEGFNVGVNYHPESPFGPYLNPWRQEITELKLKVAYGSIFPFFVVGSKQFDDLSSDIKLTIVDGIIGVVLAQRAVSEKFTKGFIPNEIGLSQEQFDSLSAYDQHEIIQNWVMAVEVAADVEHNPITRKAWEMRQDIESTSHSLKYLHFPSAEDTSSFEDRARLIETAILNGCEVTINTKTFGDVSATAWLPNFKAISFSGLGLLEEIAMILTIDKVKKIQQKKSGIVGT